MRKRYQVACLNFLCALALVGIGIFSYVFYLQMKDVNEANAWVIQSHRVIEKLYYLMSNFNYSETTLRSYFIMKEQRYYDEYIESKQKIVGEIADLKVMTKDDPDIQQKITELASVIQQRATHIDYILAIRKDHTLDYTLKYVADRKYVSPSGKILGDQILALTNELISNEVSRLEKRNSYAIKYFSNTALFAMFGSLASAVLILICFILLNRQVHYRFRAERGLRHTEDELKRLAYFDTLTGLANRTILLSNIEEAIQVAKNDGSMIGLVFIDIDNFKNINDSFGHAVGDELLKAFATLLQNHADDKHMMFRLSGDEFAILIHSIQHENEILPLLKSILEATKIPITIQTHQLFITCSIGISLYPNDGDDAKILLKSADIAMYRAKKSGKNTYQFCVSDLILEVEERALLEQQLYRAVEQKEFVIVYQPKISLKTGKITGLEALIRWNIPDEDLIFPSQFIAVAESNGLIVPIGKWLLEAVCRQGAQWLAEGVPFNSIAINISIRELSAPDFVDQVKQTLSDTNFDPHLLEFEITESILMNNSENNQAVLRELKAIGIKITIDDFGTGYSSLSYLHLFSIDKLKIDQSFVSKITSDKHNPIIINAIIGMAHSLEIQVVGEGVENAAQLHFLQKYGCDEVQGFYCSYPLTPNKVFEFIQNHDARLIQSKS